MCTIGNAPRLSSRTSSRCDRSYFFTSRTLRGLTKPTRFGESSWGVVRFRQVLLSWDGWTTFFVPHVGDAGGRSVTYLPVKWRGFLWRRVYCRSRRFLSSTVRRTCSEQQWNPVDCSKWRWYRPPEKMTRAKQKLDTNNRINHHLLVRNMRRS